MCMHHGQYLQLCILAHLYSSSTEGPPAFNSIRGTPPAGEHFPALPSIPCLHLTGCNQVVTGDARRTCLIVSTYLVHACMEKCDNLNKSTTSTIHTISEPYVYSVNRFLNNSPLLSGVWCATTLLTTIILLRVGFKFNKVKTYECI